MLENIVGLARVTKMEKKKAFGEALNTLKADPLWGPNLGNPFL